MNKDDVQAAKGLEQELDKIRAEEGRLRDRKLQVQSDLLSVYRTALLRTEPLPSPASAPSAAGTTPAPVSQEEARASIEALETISKPVPTSAELRPVRRNGRLEPDLSEAEPLVRAQFLAKNGREPDEVEVFSIMDSLRAKVMQAAPNMQPGDRLKFEIPAL